MYRGERINSISHLVGAALAFVGLMLLAVSSASTHDGWKVASALVYGLTLLVMFLFSTLFHSLRGRAKAVFRKLDHVAIYWLIAGTYTPFCLVTLRESRGWLILGIVWGIAVVGTILKSVFGAGHASWSTLLYLIAGWTIVVDISNLHRLIEPAGFAWLVAGGVLYTIGAGFYVWKRMPRHHEVWHFFVLAAAACHCVSILGYVVS